MKKQSEPENSTNAILTPFDKIEENGIDFSRLGDPNMITYAIEGEKIENGATINYEAIFSETIDDFLKNTSPEIAAGYQKELEKYTHPEVTEKLQNEFREVYESLEKKYSDSELYPKEKSKFISGAVLPEMRKVLSEDSSRPESTIQRNIKEYSKKRAFREFSKGLSYSVPVSAIPKTDLDSFKKVMKAAGKELKEAVPLDTYVEWKASKKIEDRVKEISGDLSKKVNITGPGTDPNFTKNKVPVKGRVAEETAQNSKSQTVLSSKGKNESKLYALSGILISQGILPTSRSEKSSSKKKPYTSIAPTEVGNHMQVLAFCGSEQGIAYRMGLDIARHSGHNHHLGNISSPHEHRKINFILPDNKKIKEIPANCEHGYFILTSEKKRNEMNKKTLRENNGIYIYSVASQEKYSKGIKSTKVAAANLHDPRHIEKLKSNAMVHGYFVLQNGKITVHATQHHFDGNNVNNQQQRNELFNAVDKYNRGAHGDRELSSLIKEISDIHRRQNFSLDKSAPVKNEASQVRRLGRNAKKLLSNTKKIPTQLKNKVRSV